MLKRFLKNEIIFWKNPAFDLICLETETSLPSAFLTGVPSALTSFAVTVAVALEVEVTLQLLPSADAEMLTPLVASHTIFEPSGAFAQSTFITTTSP